MSEVTVIPEKDTATIRPDGDLVAARLPPLRSRLRQLAAEGVCHLTVDLSGTQMVDSAGIGLLIAAHNSMKRAGGELKVVHASPDIVSLFRTMRIHHHFAVSGK
jgi:anti-anti-sigma factor